MMYYLIIKITKGVTMKLSRKAYKLINIWCELLNTDNIEVREYNKIPLGYYEFRAYSNHNQLFILEIPEDEIIEFNPETEEDEMFFLKELKYAD